MTPRRDDEGSPKGFLLISNDITDETRLNLELVNANAALLDANRHKTTFLANMSHELRTPLNSILGFSELLIDSGRAVPAATHAISEQIHVAGKHSRVNDILDLSRKEAGHMEAACRRCRWPQSSGRCQHRRAAGGSKANPDRLRGRARR
jgi:signal transduction histidine kinase